MSNREFVVLGSSGQVRTRARARNAAFLAWDEWGLLLDPGEGAQRQLILAGIAVSRVTHIRIAHFHGDHSLGLAGVVQRLSLGLEAASMPVMLLCCMVCTGRPCVTPRRLARRFLSGMWVSMRSTLVDATSGETPGPGEHRPAKGRIEALNDDWETLVRRAGGYRDLAYLLPKLTFMTADPVRSETGTNRFLPHGMPEPAAAWCTHSLTQTSTTSHRRVRLLVEDAPLAETREDQHGWEIPEDRRS